MELKEFVAETLKQVIDGVTAAQKYAAQNGSVVGHDKEKSIYVQSPQIVNFDVEVTTQDGVQTKGGAGIFVGPVGAGSQAGSERSSHYSNRIQFSVPLYLPVQKS